MRSSLDVPTAAAAFMGTLFADALTREVLPLVYRREPDQALAEYVDLFLGAIGVTAVAPTFAEAQANSRKAAESVVFAGKQFRRDIGWREMRRIGTGA